MAMDLMSGGGNMGDAIWQMSFAVDTVADLEFAWNYWSNVKNWDDPPARFELEGTFADGARGSTWIGEQLTMHWFVRNVRARESATIEVQLDGAVMAFTWGLEATGAGRTRLTQRAALSGEKAGALVEQARGLETTLPQGMKKLAAAIGNAAAKAKTAGA
jgi:hypothetical protein